MTGSMETPQREQLSSPKARPAAAEDGREGPGKLTRISQQTRGLVDDVKSWVDLKMTLTQMDVEDKIDARVNRAVVGVVVGALGFLGLTFGLVAASLAIGSWTGHPGWGFLIVAGVLFLVTGILLALKPRLLSVTSGSGQAKDSHG